MHSLSHTHAHTQPSQKVTEQMTPACSLFHFDWSIFSPSLPHTAVNKRVGVFVCLFPSSLKWLSAVSAVFISEASGKTQGKRPGLSLTAGFEN